MLMLMEVRYVGTEAGDWARLRRHAKGKKNTEEEGGWRKKVLSNPQEFISIPFQYHLYWLILHRDLIIQRKPFLIFIRKGNS